MEKIRGSGTAKYLYSVSYYHPRIGISGKEDVNIPLYELLENNHDIIVSVSKEKLRAIKGVSKIALLLNIDKNTPIFKSERLVCDQSDRPIENNIVYYDTAHFTYDIDIKRE